jgi:glycosyltransferase involved in cell wall biosynthesis
MSKPLGSVVFATRNRKEMLRGAILSVCNQSVPTEIIVLDDASDDGTAEMMQSDFAGISYERFPEVKGPNFLRNIGIRKASTPFAFPLDDDVLLDSPSTVEQTIAEFNDSRIGAIAIPYVNVRRDQIVRQKSPEPDRQYVTDVFLGASHAIRRDVFLKVGGYPEAQFMAGEERDLCLRMLTHGFVTCLGNAPPIKHFESPIRNVARVDFLGRRNDVIFAWQNAPLRYLPIHYISTIVTGVFYALTKAEYPIEMLRGIWAGFSEVAHGRAKRAPVRVKTYRLFRRLKKTGPLALSEVEKHLADAA